jgi:uncharacterized membrane protein
MSPFDPYPLVKTLHILSATLLYGTGLGSAFYQLFTYRSGNLEAIRQTTRLVVIADFAFTTPAVIAQLLTGLYLSARLGIPWTSPWLLTVLGLFALIGACWVPVVFLQIRLRDRAATLAALDPAYHRAMALWTALGVPAFLAGVGIYFLMVYKPWI